MISAFFSWGVCSILKHVEHLTGIAKRFFVSALDEQFSTIAQYYDYILNFFVNSLVYLFFFFSHCFIIIVDNIKLNVLYIGTTLN